MSEERDLRSVVYRKPGARITAADYDEAIQELIDAKSQLDPDGRNCAVCHDSGHQAWECHHNTLVMARRAAAARGMDGTAMPWRCFHCGCIFENEDEAREHFGERGVRGKETTPAWCERELNRLNALLNTPEIEKFDKAVPLEAAHQVERFGAEHDAGKNPEDWFWLVGYLAGKALAAQRSGDLDKAKHHCISTAAALRNWHSHLRLGHSLMRPGIGQEKTSAIES